MEPSGSSKLTLATLTNLTGLTPEEIIKAGKAGYFPSAKKGEYETVATLRGLFRFLKQQADKKGRPPTGSQSLPCYQSMASCAAATGIPLMVLKQAKADGSEAFRFSRVELGKLLPFLFAPKKKSTDGADTQDAIGDQNQNAVLNYWRARREKLRYEHETGALASKSEVRSDLIAAMAELYGSLDRVFCNQLPPAFVGLVELDIRKRCKAEIEAMKESMRTRFAKFVTAASVQETASASSLDLPDSSDSSGV